MAGRAEADVGSREAWFPSGLEAGRPACDGDGSREAWKQGGLEAGRPACDGDEQAYRP